MRGHPFGSPPNGTVAHYLLPGEAGDDVDRGGDDDRAV